MTQTVQYQDGDTALEGFVAWDSESSGAPGVLIVHQWMGLTDYEKGRCKQLAELGYVAFWTETKRALLRVEAIGMMPYITRTRRTLEYQSSGQNTGSCGTVALHISPIP